jgi:ribosomal protein S18 acetylase RimI-like enzyme
MKIVKPITDDAQKADWLKIWNESVSGQLADNVREMTWERLIDEDVPLFGFLAYADDNQPVGFCHYALHPIAGAIEPAAYMQDLFVLPVQRRRGFARAMLDALVKEGQTEQWDRILWIVEHQNSPAQKLYGNFGMKLEYNFFIYPIAMMKRLMN